ncbi:uncharacterized protein K452DRAFT_321591 [Aplosporella prunicola CBS 121167]|uniref:AA1-like domain-containing protein n=1 Tax=Aplosporella prunicola CBS 121167 TaxID=1176127 RepID=A0A6A6B2A7_9PEZI|nr:uncharacterized protein K452DRAFT_321591 [Aplosporella prunicola CBS 121167]KAF2137728.1 hypothetical protein K452DRAFT_321591 [Aplosporella prunicola CBS 121167]
MRSGKILSACAIFASSGVLAQEYLKVTNTFVTTAPRPPASVDIEVRAYDPSTETESDIATCSKFWYTDVSGWPQEFVACDKPAWNWYISTYTRPHIFDVELSHSFDDSVPAEEGLKWHRERFGRFSVAENDFTCNPVHSGQVETCRTGPRDVVVYNETYTNGNGTVFWRVPE